MSDASRFDLSSFDGKFASLESTPKCSVAAVDCGDRTLLFVRAAGATFTFELPLLHRDTARTLVSQLADAMFHFLCTAEEGY